MKRKAAKPLPHLSFKDFFGFDELSEFLQQLEAARPELCRLDSIGSSREGRNIWRLTLSEQSTPPEDKPTYIAHGGIHAMELSGTHAALHTCRRLLEDHDSGKSDLLNRVAFKIVPRLNPDGSEFFAKTHGLIRSRIDREPRSPNTLYQEDVDGDGLILTMRQEHPDGRFVLDPKDKRLLIKRTPQSRGPFFRQIPEGLIHDWDGSGEFSVEGRAFDWNRNWSFDWRPEPEQNDSGDFPFSEPEMRAFAQFMHSQPNLIGMLGYHTGPGAILRPPTTPVEAKMDPQDLRELEKLAKEASRLTGFPVFPNYKYHPTTDADAPRYGHFNNTGFWHLGVHTFEIELGLIFNSAGISTEQHLAFQTPEQYDEEARTVLKWWEKKHRKDFTLFHPWTRFKHPQLGAVEIGGMDRKYASGPSLTDLQKISESAYRYTIHQAGRHPRVVVEDASAEEAGGGIYRVRCRVANRGGYPTHVTRHGRALKRMKAPRVEFHGSENVTLLSRKGHQELGHLDGVTGSVELEWFVKKTGGPGSVSLRVLGGPGGNSTLSIPVS